jgi:hypothetical protein
MLPALAVPDAADACCSVGVACAIATLRGGVYDLRRNATDRGARVVVRGGYERVPYLRLSERRDRKEELMVTADYNLVRERVDLYVERTGLSRAAVNAYRKTPTGEWTTARDRRIGRAIRGLERSWRDPEVSIELWLRIARGVTRAISEFLNDVITTIAQLGTRLAKVIGRAIAWAERTAERIDAFIERHKGWLKRMGAFIGKVIDAAGPITLKTLANG